MTKDFTEMSDEELMHYQPPELESENEEEEENAPEDFEEPSDQESYEEGPEDTPEEPEEPNEDPFTGSGQDTTTLNSEEMEEFYRRVLSPFKANGKDIAPRNADEVVKLMQMGANYTKKMQEISPYRKTILMLEKQGLLDEEKLSYLMDLHNKNPDAIKKLLKDSNIDPYDLNIDEDSPSEYVPNNQYAVSDQEIAFDAVLDEVESLPGGQETIATVHTTWDQQSKKVLWESPELLQTIHTQRQKGIYQVITSEIERMRVLGQIPAHLSFLEAYKAVGDQLDAQGAFNHLVQANPAAVAVTRGKSKVATQGNDSRAKSASITRGNSNKRGGKIVDLTNTSDDAFLEAMSKLV